LIVRNLHGSNEKDKYEYCGCDVEKICEKIHSKLISQHSLGETKENHKNS
jgi:hypothetical protein